MIERFYSRPSSAIMQALLRGDYRKLRKGVVHDAGDVIEALVGILHTYESDSLHMRHLLNVSADGQIGGVYSVGLVRRVVELSCRVDMDFKEVDKGDEPGPFTHWKLHLIHIVRSMPDETLDVSPSSSKLAKCLEHVENEQHCVEYEPLKFTPESTFSLSSSQYRSACNVGSFHDDVVCIDNNTRKHTPSNTILEGQDLQMYCGHVVDDNCYIDGICELEFVKRFHKSFTEMLYYCFDCKRAFDYQNQRSPHFYCNYRSRKSDAPWRT